MRKKLFIDHVVFRLLVPPVYGVLVYMIILLLFNSLDQLTATFFSREVLVTIVLTVLLFEGIHGIKSLINRFSDTKLKIATRLILQLTFSGIYSIVMISGLLWIYFTQIEGFSTFTTELFMFNGIYFISSVFYNLLYFSLDFLNRQNDAKLKNEQKISQNLEIDFQNYRNDLNPELLIDSLETIITLLPMQPQTADMLVEKLSEVYRYVLSNKANDLVLMEKEIEALENLLQVLNYKFADRIQLEVNLNSSQDFYIVPCTLLILLEEAVNSSIISPHTPLELTLRNSSDSEFTFEYSSNERLMKSSDSTEKLNKINNAFNYFTNRKIRENSTTQQIRLIIPKIFVEVENE